MKIVSACLAGIKCRYDGKSNPSLKVKRLVKKGQALPICPEQLGGLPTPRSPAEIKTIKGVGKKRKIKVISKAGQDVTKNFLQGARESLKIAKIVGAKEAIFKSYSPSCGCGLIYDGTFSGKLIKGDGITTSFFKKNKLKVITEKDL